MKSKYNFFSLFVTLIISVFCQSCNNEGESKEATKKENITEIEFKENSHDFGIINQGEIVTHAFHLTNTGKKSLIIKHIDTTCGCTVSKYDKRPIPPGESSIVEIQFNSKGKFGNFHKTIKVFANIKSEIYELDITGLIKSPEPVKNK